MAAGSWVCKKKLPAVIVSSGDLSSSTSPRHFLIRTHSARAKILHLSSERIDLPNSEQEEEKDGYNKNPPAKENDHGWAHKGGQGEEQTE